MFFRDAGHAVVRVSVGGGIIVEFEGLLASESVHVVVEKSFLDFAVMSLCLEFSSDVFLIQ
jgi:hypothetical protein